MYRNVFLHVIQDTTRFPKLSTTTNLISFPLLRSINRYIFYLYRNLFLSLTRPVSFYSRCTNRRRFSPRCKYATRRVSTNLILFSFGYGSINRLAIHRFVTFLSTHIIRIRVFPQIVESNFVHAESMNRGSVFAMLLFFPRSTPPPLGRGKYSGEAAERHSPSAVWRPINSEYSPSPALLNALTLALYRELKCNPSTVQIVSRPQYTSWSNTRRND